MGKSAESKILNDLHWVNTLGEADLLWVVNGIEDIKGKIKSLKEEATKHGVHPYAFANLESYMGMFAYVMENRHSYWESEKDNTQQAIDALGESK